jgi:hypothetical protein
MAPGAAAPVAIAVVPTVAMAIVHLLDCGAIVVADAGTASADKATTPAARVIFVNMSSLRCCSARRL